ncbi:hypothetical protein Bca4012_082174 [Brassica carinata]
MKTRRRNLSGDLSSTTGRNTGSKTLEDRRDSSLPIPIDLIIDIFSRLPVKSIAICRCVSKTWSSVLGRQYFTELFLSRSCARPKLLLAYQKGGDLFFFSAPQPQNPDENSSPVVASYHMKFYSDAYFRNRNGEFEVSGLDHGLIGLTNQWISKKKKYSELDIVGSEVLVFVGMTRTNEIVMESLDHPQSPLYLFYFNTERNNVVRVVIQGMDVSEYDGVHIFLDHEKTIIFKYRFNKYLNSILVMETKRVMAKSLFGYDPIDKQVKVLSMSQASDGLVSEEIQIMTLGMGQLSQRIIKCGRVLHYYQRWKGRCINGVLYYKAFEKSTKTCLLVCFDVRSEKFSFIKVGMIFEGTLVNYNGKLGLLRSIGGISRKK